MSVYWFSVFLSLETKWVLLMGGGGGGIQRNKIGSNLGAQLHGDEINFLNGET